MARGQLRPSVISHRATEHTAHHTPDDQTRATSSANGTTGNSDNDNGDGAMDDSATTTVDGFDDGDSATEW